MTAEIVVMNREAVALAADSAVTIGGGPKILNTANKIFALAPTCNVGILLYSNAAFMGVPWEIIIKSYRDKIIEENLKFPHLEDCAIGFLNFIMENITTFVKEEQETGFFRSMVFSEYGNVLKVIWRDIKKVFYSKAEISDDEICEIVSRTINTFYNNYQKRDEILSEESSNEFRLNLVNKFKNSIDQIIKEGFGAFSLSEADLTKLREICLFIFSKRDKMNGQNPPFTGIVFAGYGNEDIFPTCVDYKVYSYLCENLIYLEEEKNKIGFSQDETYGSAFIIPFAQDDVVRNILDGKLMTYEGILRRELRKKLKPDEINKILLDVNKEIWNVHTQPILDTIEILPKDELASVARTLVSLTSFMRRVSSDLESVGGPIDVAVISKKDGFIWIDRKHYFDLSKNLHYSNNK